MLEHVAMILGSVLGSSVLTALGVEYLRKRKTQAEARETDAKAEVALADSTLDWTKVLTQRIDALEKRIDLLQTENVQLKVEIVKLETELRLYKEGKVYVTTVGSSVDVKNS